MLLRDIHPTYYQRSVLPSLQSSSTLAGRRTLVVPGNLSAVLPIFDFHLPADTGLDLNIATTWDTTTGTDYTVAANRAGKDFYLYATTSGLIISANATVPTGYTADNSRRIGGFHCLCVGVGTISGHPLSGFLAGDILPASIWDMLHRPTSAAEGMVYSNQADLWVDIYLQSGTAGSTASVFGATITDTRNWMDFVDDLAAVGKRLLRDAEFQVIAEGSNQRTNIAGSADPVTVGGYSDTAGRRMISNIGCESCCGAMWQWLADTQFRIGGLVDPTVDPAYSWYALPGNKGSLNRQGSAGDIKLRAGGAWNDGLYCGARSRGAVSERWTTSSSLGSRGCANFMRSGG